MHEHEMGRDAGRWGGSMGSVPISGKDKDA